MGLFGVHMPPLYGEGKNAFYRLQLEILQSTTDESIFAWSNSDFPERYEKNILADSPLAFRFCRYVVQAEWVDISRPAIMMTNKGLRMELYLMAESSSSRLPTFLAPLKCIDLSIPASRDTCLTMSLVQPSPGEVLRVLPLVQNAKPNFMAENLEGQRTLVYLRQEPRL